MNPKGFQLILTKLLGNQDTKALAMLSKHHLDTMKTPKSLLEEKKIMLDILHFARLVTSFSLTKHLSQIKTSY